MLLENLRYIGFQLFDLAHSGEVRKAYREIKTVDSLDSMSVEMKEYQQAKLADLIKHACATVPFYKNLSNVEKLDDFPIINKNVICACKQNFLSSSFQGKRLFRRATSGSTGIPFVSYHDIRKKKRVHAETIYYSEKVGYKIGSPLIYLRMVKRNENKSKVQKFIQNQPVFSIGDLSDNGIEKLLKQIEPASRSGHAILLAHPSSLEVLCQYFLRRGLGIPTEIKIGGVLSIGEMLFDENRENIEKVFQCKCISRYSNAEQGIIGQESLVHHEFLLNEANYIIEVLDVEKDVPVPEGQVGRIVITDLFNYAMPFIRYDTGDIGKVRLVEHQGIRKKALCDFGGRRVDTIFGCDGQTISPYTIAITISDIPNIRQYQFVQTGNAEYVLKINAVESEQLSQGLISNLTGILGEGVHIAIEYIDEIPVLATGKRKCIVNEMLIRDQKQ